MASNRTMSTEEIKRGLQNIKKAQLQVLKQLRADSILPQQNTSISTVKSMTNLTSAQQKQKSQKQQNNQNYQELSNLSNKSVVVTKQKIPYIHKQLNQKLAQTNESSSTVGSSGSAYEALRKQMTAEREELNNKLIEISNKLNSIEKESVQVHTQAKVQDSQLNSQIRRLQDENRRLESRIRAKDEKIESLQNGQKSLRGQLQLRGRSIAVLEAEVKSLRMQNTKLSRLTREMEGELRQYKGQLKQLREEKEQVRTQQSRLDMDLVMKEVKAISSSHDFLFNKLKESTTIDMSWVEKESEIQNSFSRLLEYFQNVSSSASSSNHLTINEDNLNANMTNSYVKGVQGHNKPKEMIKRSMIWESRGNEESELEQLAKDMGPSYARGQVKELMDQNEQLRRKITQLTIELAGYQSQYGRVSDNKYVSESNRLIGLQIEQMREQVVRFRRFKAQVSQEREEQEKQIVKYKIKSKQLQAKAQSTERKLVQTTNAKFVLQKQVQEKSIQITSLNSIIKELTNKLTPTNQHDSPLSQLRQQFTKLLETNSLLQRENQSLKAMNEGLQAQIQTLKYEKDQFQTNNKQKHELIEREIRQRNHLLQQIENKRLKHNQLNEEVEKLKTALSLNEQHSLKQKKNFEDLLQQKNDEVLQLRKEIEELYKQSREYHQLRFSFDRLQKQHKELARKSLKMGETLTHLWSVKQAEYCNINQILGLLKSSQSVVSENQNSGHF